RLLVSFRSNQDLRTLTLKDMSQQENDNDRKDLPKKQNLRMDTESGYDPDGFEEGNNEEDPGEKAFSASMNSTTDKTVDEEDDHLENAMLDETNSGTQRSESREKEKEYSNGLKADEKESPGQSVNSISPSDSSL